MVREGESIRRLVELVLELGSEEDRRARKGAGRSERFLWIQSVVPRNDAILTEERPACAPLPRPCGMGAGRRLFSLG